MTTPSSTGLFGPRFARDLWRLTRIYWSSPDAPIGALLLALCISLDERRSREDPQLFLWAIEYLCEATGNDPRELGLPDAAALTARRGTGTGPGTTRRGSLLGSIRRRIG